MKMVDVNDVTNWAVALSKSNDKLWLWAGIITIIIIGAIWWWVELQTDNETEDIPGA